jgi:hypothetical protein
VGTSPYKNIETCFMFQHTTKDISEELHRVNAAATAKNNMVDTNTSSLLLKKPKNKRKSQKLNEPAKRMPLPPFSHKQQASASGSSTMIVSTTGTSDVTYNANALGQSSVRRIRTPAPHDVLSGRGGSVNAHPGNCQFRDWVHLKKEEYNLARTKQAKADICRTVIAKVVALGGRFLARENANSQWWIEQDDERVMSKTSQALREGAPKIREAHREELGLPNASSSAARRKPRHLNELTIQANLLNNSSKRAFSSIQSAPVSRRQSALDASHTDDSNNKRVRVDYMGKMVLTNEETPPLRSVESPQSDGINERLQEFKLMPAPSNAPLRFPSPLSRTRASDGSRSNLPRMNSLAISDIIAEEAYEFVNPFDDEPDFLLEDTASIFNSHGSTDYNDKLINNNTKNQRTNSGSSSSRNSFTLGAMSPRPGLWRESSVSSTTSDFAGFGALMRGTDSQCNTNSMLMTSDSTLGNSMNSTAHLVPLRSSSCGSKSTDSTTKDANKGYALTDEKDYDDDDDDNRSTASESTLGLPLWDWFNRDDAFTTTTKTSHPKVSHHAIPISLQ